MPQTIGPCADWISEASLCEPCVSETYTADPDLMADAITMASHALFFATAQQFTGECEVTVHPCSCSSFPVETWTVEGGILTVAPFSIFSACGCSRRASCSCTHQSAITLPFIPAIEVTEVSTTDDGVLPVGSYVLHGQDLIRIDGESWPLCDDDFLVTYTYGRSVPLLLQRAAAVLACELYMACSPESFEGQCRLPRNIVSIARQGVSVIMESAFWVAPRPGRPIQFGIPEIDLAIATYNPHGLIAPSVILSPDDPDLARLIDP